MKEEQGEETGAGHQPLPGFGDTQGTGQAHRDPPFDSADDPEEDYEEPDRDTNFAGGLREEEPEDDPFDTLLPEDLQDGDRALYERQSAFLRSEYAAMDRPGGAIEAAAAATFSNRGEPAEPGRSPGWQDGDDDWPEEDLTAHPEDWADEDEEDDGDGAGRWPLGLIIVALLAVMLVLAGGYGIMQQRAATQAELVELRAALATATSPEELAAAREALQGARQRNAGLAAELDALRQENQDLRATTAELQAQLAPLSSTGAPPVESEGQTMPAAAPEARPTAPTAPSSESSSEPSSAAAASPEPAARAAAEPAPAGGQTASAAGDWFVNFGSYGQRTMARTWAARLQPGAGEVVVAEAARDGRTLYRVRVVGLPDKGTAEQVAGQLEDAWGLSKLWVGRE